MRARIATAAVLAGLALAAPASAASISEFGYAQAGANPIDMTRGADGAVYALVANWISGEPVVRLGPNGATRVVTDDVGPAPLGGLTTGPDGNLWVAGLQGSGPPYVERVTPAGAKTAFPLPDGLADARGIAGGPDGALWFTAGAAIGRITTAGAVSSFPVPGADATRIAAGPDGDLWFTEPKANRIGRITPAGVVTEFALPAGREPEDIAGGPGGDVWFTELRGNAIGRITPAGAVTEVPLPGARSMPERIAAGPDGAVWFTESDAGLIGRLAPSLALSEYALPTPSAVPRSIATAADGHVWFAEQAGPAFGRLAPGEAPALSLGPATHPAPDAITLHGLVAGRDRGGRVTFEYGAGNPDLRFTHHVTATAGPESAAVSATLTGLTPDELYEYRLVVATPDGDVRSTIGHFAVNARAGARLLSTALRLHHGHIAVRIACVTPTCRGSLVLSARHRVKGHLVRVTLGRARYAFRSRRAHTLSLHPTGYVHRYGKRRSIPARVALSTNDIPDDVTLRLR